MKEKIIKKPIELSHFPIIETFKLYYCGILLKPNKDYILKNNILTIKKRG